MLNEDVVNIDKTDRKIISVLQNNSRLSFRKIAEKTGVSVATALNRVNRLNKEGVIKKYSAIIDYERLGYEMEAIVEVKIANKNSNPLEIEPFVLNHPNVHSVFTVSGVLDHVILVKFQNRRQLNDFLKKLNSLPSIESSQTRFIMKNFREDDIRV